ncbi:hypothetical protein BC830DRAFT_1106657 [Chytriomyces sp. MP71]|nr:hypothetical protein BC830DRAFT_1106657 [Chytriomyces sp. MP71]
MPKGKKGTKNAVDKALAEEEERKRLDEEARLTELRAKKEKEIKDQREREAFEAFFNQEKDRLEEETREFLNHVESLNTVIKKITTAKRSETDWKRFLECSILPDPQNEPELNTYLSLWAEEPVGNDDDPSVQALIDALPGAEKLCNNIAEAISIECDNQNQAAQVNLRVHLATMRQLIQSKWDKVSCRIIQHYDHFECEANENFHFSTSTTDYICGLWGNLTRNPRHKIIEYGDIKLSMTLPKPISLANVAIRMLYESGFTVSAPYFFQDSEQHMSVIGGVLFLDLFEMPEAPKIMSHMAIRQILSPTGKLKVIQYPFKKTVTEAAEEEGEAEGATSDYNVWPAQITYEISPDSFIHKESAKMMSWDEVAMAWSEDSIGDVEINIGECQMAQFLSNLRSFLETGQIKFRTTQFRPTAFMQKTYAELPFMDWSIESTEAGRAKVRIQGTSNEIKFEMLNGKCHLISPMTAYLEKHMAGQWFTPSLFFMKLSQVGLNFQGPQSLKGVDIDPSIIKNPVLENLAVEGIGLCSQLFAVRRSLSNRIVSSNKIVMQVQQLVPGQEISEDPASWKTILFDSSCRIGENDQKFGFWIPEGEVTEETKYDTANSDKFTLHSTIYSLLKSLVDDPKALTILEGTDPVFAKTVIEILQATRLLAFSG